MKVLNFGSVNIDYVYQVPHFIQPGETLPSYSLSVKCGGKGLNQSIALAKAGAEVYHACRIGAEGGFLTEKLKSSGVDTRYIHPGQGSCGHAIIQVTPDAQNAILLYGGTNQQMDKAFIDDVLCDFGADDVLILQNETNCIAYMIERAVEKGMRVAFNAAPFHEAVWHYPLEKLTWLVVNEVEGTALAGTQSLEDVPGILHERYQAVNVLLTLGGNGCLYIGADGVRIRCNAVRVNAVDTTAAGDTHFGYFMQGVLCGMPVQDALRLASVASAIAVTRPGAADSIPEFDEAAASMASASWD